MARDGSAEVGNYIGSMSMPIRNSAYLSDLFHLEEKHVPVQLGEELTYELEDDTQELRVEVVMRRSAEELVLKKDLEVVFYIRNTSAVDFQIRCIPQDEGAFRGCALLEQCPDLKARNGRDFEIRMPWLDNYKYPLGVWFFALRNMLKKPNLRPYTNTMMMRMKFPHKKTFYGNFPYPETTPSVLRTSGSALGLLVGAGRTKGSRPYMEDFDFCYRTMQFGDVYSAVSLLGVFDGHGGTECPSFMAEELPGIIRKSIVGSSSRGVCKMSLAQTLHESFIKADKEWLRSAHDVSGTTATVMLFEGGGEGRNGKQRGPGLVCLASTGDSRAVLCRGSKALELTIDHKAGACDIIARIAQTGGFVDKGRVMGSLAVGRALGDSHLKKGKNLKKGPWSGTEEALIPDPDVISFVPRRCGNSEEDDHFIIIASDGLWDVMNNQEAINKVNEQVSKICEREGYKNLDYTQMSERDISQVCENLALGAVKAGSRDNVTVEIAFFTGTNGYSAQSDAVLDEETVEYVNSYATGGAGAKEVENKENSRGREAPAGMGGGKDFLSSIVDSLDSPAKSTPAPYSVEESKISSNKHSEASAGAKNTTEFDDDELMDFLNDDSNF